MFSYTRVVFVVRPDGKEEVVEVDAIPVLYQRTSQTGFYTYRFGSVERQFAVNLLDRAESQVNSRFSPTVFEEPVDGTGRRSDQSLKAKKDIWIYFVIGMLLLALGEWFFWLREKQRGQI